MPSSLSDSRQRDSASYGKGPCAAEGGRRCRDSDGTWGVPTPAQVDAVLTLTATDRLHNYLVLSLLTGTRTEELRALRWEHVHLDQIGSVPAHIEVWRSVREDGDTKTRKVATDSGSADPVRRYPAEAASAPGG